MTAIDYCQRTCASLMLVAIACSAAAEEPQVTYHIDKSSERTPLHTVVPVYPERARRDRVEGEVQVCYNVTRAGKTQRISVRRSTHRIFERAAIRAVRASTYRPLPADQKPTGIKTCRTFRFHLTPLKPDDAPKPS